MPDHRPPPIPCDRCGRFLLAGATRYVMRLRLTADFDGYLPEPEAGETAESLFAAAEAMETGELEAQVDQLLAFAICPACRLTILRDPLQRGGGGPNGSLQ